MAWKKSKILTDLYSHIVRWQDTGVKCYSNYRCKIVGLSIENKSKEMVLSVMISGIKNQIIPYFPKDLVLDDEMLAEFSPVDIRAITFCAIMQARNESEFLSKRSISGQIFVNGKSVFIIKERNNQSEIRKTAEELYYNMDLLIDFSKTDLINIVSTAIQEQTIEDLEKTEKI